MTQSVDFDKLAPFNEGGTDMNMDWLLNTGAGRNTYARYLHAGGQPFDVMNAAMDGWVAGSGGGDYAMIGGKRFNLVPA